MAKEALNFTVGADTKGFQDSLRGAASKLAAFSAGFVSFQQVTQYLGKAIDSASNLAETTSKVGVIFGDSANKIQAFAQTSAVSLGQTKQQAMDAAATFATFGKAAGLNSNELVSFSTNLTALSSDLASFSNTTPEEAITAIGAALRGEAEPIRRFGVLLDDATLRAQALKMGLIATTKEALTPGQKVLAAYRSILAQTSDAQGDFARTADGLANSQRILNASVEDLTASVGVELLPAMTRFVDYLNSNTIPAVIGAKGYFDEFRDSVKGVADQSPQAAEGIKATGVVAKTLIETLVPAIGAMNQFNQAQSVLAQKGREITNSQNEAAKAILESVPSGNAIQNFAESLGDPIAQAIALQGELLGVGNTLKAQTPILEQNNKIAAEHLANYTAQNKELEEHKKLIDFINGEKQDELKLELDIAEAKANGNESEQKRLEWIRQYNQELERAKAAGMSMQAADDFARRKANAETTEPQFQATPNGGSGGSRSIPELRPQGSSRGQLGRLQREADRFRQRAQHNLNFGQIAAADRLMEQAADREKQIQDKIDAAREKMGREKSAQPEVIPGKGGSRPGEKPSPIEDPIKQILNYIKSIHDNKLPVNALTA